MKILMEVDLRDFPFESDNAIELAERIWNENAWNTLEYNLSQMYPEGISENALEDLFTHDDEAVLKLAEIEEKEGDE
nr:MAG TPA: hypothetical protein [Caudoviricetes sp.]